MKKTKKTTAKKTKKTVVKKTKKTSAQLDREIAEILHQPSKKSLREERAAAAQAHFEDATDLPEIAGVGNWEEDGDYWSISVYWESEDGGDSTSGSYGVEFAPGSAKIIDQWVNY